MDLLLKIAFAFIIQSNIFFLYLKNHKEKHLFIWNTYFATNVFAAILTLLLGHFLGFYFPLYLFFLLIIYYILYVRYEKGEKELATILTYFSINLYVIFFLHLFFSITLNIPYILFLICSVYLCIMMIQKKILLGIYVLPVLWYLSMLIIHPYLIGTMLDTMFHSFPLNTTVVAQLFVLILIGFLCIMEVCVHKFLFRPGKEEESHEMPSRYERIMKQRSMKSRFQTPRR